MAIGRVKERYEKYVPREYSFYRDHYHHVIIVLMVLIFIAALAVGVVLYQILNRPLPVFHAVQPNGKKMLLTPFQEPNLLPDTILRWASKAATISYTLDFANYNSQLTFARPYFTEDGWQGYLRSAQGIIGTITSRKIIVNGVVSGTPVISNQGELPGKGYVWRVQIPFLVTYITANGTNKRNFYVVMSIIKVPTTKNPQGIGIDQFTMS